MDNPQIKDKAIFIAALLAAFFPLIAFKDYLSNIKVVILDGHLYTIWSLILFSIIFLMISIYLYALSYIQHNLGKFKNNFIFKPIFNIIIFTANFTYSLALISPILIIITALLQATPPGIFMLNHPVGTLIFDISGSVFLIVASIMNAKFLGKEKVLD